VTSQHWQPSASLAVLQQAAVLKRLIRGYMDKEGVLEVSTPLLSQAATTDPQLYSLKVARNGQTAYLHTSPEFPMKRLLAAYRRDIYQIVPVFRDAEQGRRHNMEFTLLEWYRVGMDHVQLMDSIDNLFQSICETFDINWCKPLRKRYADLIENELYCTLSDVTVPMIKAHFQVGERSFPDSDLKLDAALDLLFDTFILPQFSQGAFSYIVDYPASQAALARTVVDSNGTEVAQRFELYYGSLEIGNGYHELRDASILEQRIKQDQAVRESQGLDPMPVDKLMLAAHQAGLPDCAGVAIGVERLLMLLSNASRIDDVVAFPTARA
jgi:lysyl-tRNA synthetase class 2